MRRAYNAIAKFPDERLFQVLSEGLPLIVENAADFDATAYQLHQDGNYRAAVVFRGFAEEEAAKVLVLMDLVRCPLEFPERAGLAKRIRGHLAKRVYAEMSSYPNIWSFEELQRCVKLDCQPYFLEGPNQVDWILRNSILEKREQSLYVDFVQDLTDDTDAYQWRVPPDSRPPVSFLGLDQYRQPGCVQLVENLLSVGACSREGLAVLAAVWRDFRPQPETTRDALRKRIRQTLDRLECRGFGTVDTSAATSIVRRWQFPMWSIPIPEPQMQLDELATLRARRQRAIRQIEEIESVRDPVPAISRAKVEALSEAHGAWQREVDARGEGAVPASGTKGLRMRSGADLDDDFSLPSYKRVVELWCALTEEERVSLLALGWYTRGQIADWARTYEHAVNSAPTLDEHYHIGLGEHWLAGLQRWEQAPEPFEAGRWYEP